jgi:hypothetical protein
MTWLVTFSIQIVVYSCHDMVSTIRFLILVGALNALACTYTYMHIYIHIPAILHMFHAFCSIRQHLFQDASSFKSTNNAQKIANPSHSLSINRILS